MRVVILARGLGTRLMEETQSRPKPMLETGSIPILNHSLTIYRRDRHKDFVVCLGCKGSMIKEYLANFFLLNSHVVVDRAGRSIKFANSAAIQQALPAAAPLS
jgi:glucose-1-phosphate cytidylyltransferase